MEVKIIDGPETVVVVSGRVDTTASPEFEKALQPILESTISKVKMDCNRLEYLSSSGLRLFLILQKNIKSKGGLLRICGLNDAIRETFNLTGFASIFNIE